MKKVSTVIYRYLTDADFFNINKLPGTESGGGGQGYIDFPINNITVNDWDELYDGVQGVSITSVANGKCWEFPIKSIGLINTSQSIKIYQRRAQSISIAAQKLHTRKSNRVCAWLPKNYFPAPADPNDRNACPNNLAIYIVKTEDNEIWAGWFNNHEPFQDDLTKNILNDMLIENTPGKANIIKVNSGDLLMDEQTINNTFFTVSHHGLQTPIATVGNTSVEKERLTYSDDYLLTQLFKEDELYTNVTDENIVTHVTQVRKRNTKAVKHLKALYKGKCQVTGEKLSFIKVNGELYCEAHHLIPLAEDGADSAYNLIIVSPLIHKMLHYANVSTINLNNIENNQLEIQINNENYTITWHPEHAKHIEKCVNT